MYCCCTFLKLFFTPLFHTPLSQQNQHAHIQPDPAIHHFTPLYTTLHTPLFITFCLLYFTFIIAFTLNHTPFWSIPLTLLMAVTPFIHSLVYTSSPSSSLPSSVQCTHLLSLFLFSNLLILFYFSSSSSFFCTICSFPIPWPFPLNLISTFLYQLINPVQNWSICANCVCVCVYLINCALGVHFKSPTKTDVWTCNSFLCHFYLYFPFSLSVCVFPVYRLFTFTYFQNNAFLSNLFHSFIHSLYVIESVGVHRVSSKCRQATMNGKNEAGAVRQAVLVVGVGSSFGFDFDFNFLATASTPRSSPPPSPSLRVEWITNTTPHLLWTQPQDTFYCVEKACEAQELGSLWSLWVGVTSRVVRLTPEAIRCVMSKSGSRNCLIGIRTVDSTRLGWDSGMRMYLSLGDGYTVREWVVMDIRMESIEEEYECC